VRAHTRAEKREGGRRTFSGLRSAKECEAAAAAALKARALGALADRADSRDKVADNILLG
jgi:hypothetical protein